MRGAVESVAVSKDDATPPCSLLIAKVAHQRKQPKHHGFCYGMYYLCFPLSKLDALASPLLSVDKPNLYSFRQRDHGAPEMDNDAWIRGILREHGLDEVVDGDIMLVTLPRLMGYVFNPVSFWFCLDGDQQLRAVLCEVNNTFGERHCYLCYHDDMRPIAPDDWLYSRKEFHVSPFMEVKGDYRYRFIFNERKVAVWIHHGTEEGDMLHTSLIGERVPLTTRSLLRCFVRYPLVTLRVIGLIHWHALKLTLKGIRYRRKPAPPEHTLTRGG